MDQSVATRLFVGLPAVALATLACSAASANGPDRMEYHAIAAGNFAAAERSLLAERRIFPHRPELTLNLAIVYGRTGRVALAHCTARFSPPTPSIFC